MIEKALSSFIGMPIARDARRTFLRFESTGMWIRGSSVSSSNCENVKGVKWKPQAGTAIFWEDLDENEKATKKVLHAELSVLEVSNIGLDI